MAVRSCVECGKSYVPTSPRQKRCAEHKRSEAGRYNARHRQLRAEWQAKLDSGQQVFCCAPVCRMGSRLIEPGTLWDLGHGPGGDDDWRGPEHQRCNRSSAGREGQRGYRARIVADAGRQEPRAEPPQPFVIW